jgi:hypothetical protein
MNTSRSIHRMLFSAALLLLPLLNYCSDMVGTPYPDIRPVDQVETFSTPVSSALQGAQENDAARTRRILADVENRTRTGF